MPLLGLANTLVVGHLQHSYFLGAVGFGVIIFNLFFWGFSFLRMGTTGLVAQAFGRKNFSEISNITIHSIAVALLISVCLIILQVPLQKLIFSFYDGSEKVRFYAEQYYYIRIWGAPAALINMTLVGLFIGMQKTRVPLLMMSLVSVVAIILDFVLVFDFDMTADGVALADIVGQYCGLIVGLLYLYSFLKGSLSLSNFHFQKKLLKEIFSANRDIFLRSISLIIVMTFFNFKGAKLGVTILAANTVLLNFQMLAAFALDGFANAAEALVGESIGDKNTKQLTKVVWMTTAWSVVIALIFVMIYSIFGKEIISMMTNIDLVYQMSLRFLPFVIVLPLVSVWCFELDGVFIGAKKFKEMRNAMLWGLAGFLLVWYFSKSLDNTGLWMAFLSFFIFRALFMGVVLLRAKLIKI